ncbi:MAG: hypothetical protein IJ880_15675 [Bacilli bacterium]|nr:hypothetical protein [Bacilli bacterium]
MDSEKMQAKRLMAKFMEMSLKHSRINVPQPMPVIEEKAQKRLSTDGLISFKLILKEWEKLSIGDKQTIAKLLMVNSHDIIEIIEGHGDLVEETKDTPEFVAAHPEYGREENTLDKESIMDEFDKLFED